MGDYESPRVMGASGEATAPTVALPALLVVIRNFRGFILYIIRVGEGGGSQYAAQAVSKSRWVK